MKNEINIKAIEHIMDVLLHKVDMLSVLDSNSGPDYTHFVFHNIRNTDSVYHFSMRNENLLAQVTSIQKKYHQWTSRIKVNEY